MRLAGISLRHLRVFQAVAKLRSIHRAAEDVSLTQPAVTRAVANLELRVNAALFERRSHGTYLTAAGELFAARVERAFQQIEDTLSKTGCAAQGGRGLASVCERITQAQISAVVAIADGKAGTSMTAFARTVRELERVLNRQLLDHNADGLRTTKFGKDLAQTLRFAMREVQAGIEEIARTSEERDTCLRVGALPLTNGYIVAPVLSDLVHWFPNADVQIRCGDNRSLAHALQTGEIDFIVGLLCEDVESDKVDQEAITPLSYVVVAHPDHPLAGKPHVGIADLEGYGWVAPNHNTSRRVAFDRLAQSFRTPPTSNIQASTAATIRLLLSENDRLALLTRFEFEHHRGSSALVEIQVDLIQPVSQLGITHRSNLLQTQLHAKFMELFRKQARVVANSSNATRLSVLEQKAS